uniref:AAA family ATPase n=1 Tax=Clostridium perfringens TaxID=1502 RepID=UPI003221860C
MIVGIFLRYYKTYSGTHYIPLSSGSQFCGIVGDNGIGKSSVLEALDSFINNKPWNINTSYKKAGSDRAQPHIVPVFLIKRDQLPGMHHEKAEMLTKLALEYNLNSPDINLTPTTRGVAKTFCEHISKIRRNVNISEYFLIPLGIEKDGEISASILNGKPLVKIIGDSDSE